jgi:hypothetical protein
VLRASDVAETYTVGGSVPLGVRLAGACGKVRVQNEYRHAPSSMDSTGLPGLVVKAEVPANQVCSAWLRRSGRVLASPKMSEDAKFILGFG